MKNLDVDANKNVELDSFYDEIGISDMDINRKLEHFAC